MTSKTSFIGYLFKSYFQALKEAQAKKPQEPVKVAVVCVTQEDAELFQRELVTCLNNGVTAVAKEGVVYNVQWFFADTLHESSQGDFDVLLSFTTPHSSDPSVYTVNVIGYNSATDSGRPLDVLYFVGRWDQSSPENCQLVTHTDSDTTLLGITAVQGTATW